MAKKTPETAAGVHAVVGPDTFLAEQALDRLLQAAVGNQREGAVNLFRGDETSWVRIVDAARSPSLFVSRRAVVVRAADAIKGEGEELLAYLEDPSPDTALLLLADKPDKRRTLWKRLLEGAESVTLAEPLKGRALFGFVGQEVRARKLALGEEGLQELVDRVGQDLRRLMGELDKLEAYAQGKRLSADDVAAVLGRGQAQPLYKLADAIGARKGRQALTLMHELLEDGEPALRILATLHRALRQVRGALALREARASRDEIASRLRIPPFKVGDVLDATRVWTDQELAAAMVTLHQADLRIKTGVEGEVALVAAVVSVCAPAKGRPATPSSSGRAR
jgi:DNA polymerase-3 subunit delta